MRELLDAGYRSESRRVFATLIRLLGDFDASEEALHDAFRAALEQWPRDGVPKSPRAWLVSVGRFKAIDRMRRRARFDALQTRYLLHGPTSGALIPKVRRAMASRGPFRGRLDARQRRCPGPRRSRAGAR